LLCALIEVRGYLHEPASGGFFRDDGGVERYGRFGYAEVGDGPHVASRYCAAVVSAKLGDSVVNGQWVGGLPGTNNFLNGAVHDLAGDGGEVPRLEADFVEASAV
jgi:hypothetical protein